MFFKILSSFLLSFLSFQETLGGPTPFHRTCGVELSWFPPRNSSEHNFFPETEVVNWPGGIVYYTIDASVLEEDRHLVTASFADYHKKTCIQFKPRTTQVGYVNIEYDPTAGACGVAEVGYTGRAQWARFGAGCRDLITIVHELGHTLTAAHEHWRFDRDDWLDFSKCAAGDEPPPTTDESYLTYDLYFDYASAMMYECNWCLGGWPKLNASIKCDGQISTNIGLSVLDAEKFNLKYDCGGCHSHRFRPISKLTDEESKTLIDGGGEYICRRYWPNGDILIGTGYITKRKSECVLTYDDESQSFDKTDGFEVLTNPKKVKGYRWQKSKGTIPTNAVPGGRTMMGETIYIGRCSGVLVNSNPIGSVFESSPDTLSTRIGLEVTVCLSFKILVCDDDDKANHE